MQEKDCVCDLEFLRLSSADNYNGGIGDADVSDHKCGSYRPDRFMRKIKWWWAIWIWGLGVLLANCYVCYVTYLLSQGVEKRNILSQYEFRKAIALAWIDPKSYWKSTSKKRSADTLNETVGVNTRNKKIKKSKATCITDDSFGPNGNMKDRMSRAVDHDLELCTKHSRCAIHRWATDRKVSLHTNVFFCPGCNICVCIECHKLLRHEKDILGMKKELCCKFTNEMKDRRENRIPLSPTSDARAEMGRLNRETKTQCV